MILDRIAQAAKKRVQAAKETVTPEKIREMAERLPKGTLDFEEALKADGISFICEVKKASPSKGLISPEFPYLTIAEEYEQAGAAAVSVLTEPEFFMGDNRYLADIAAAISIPVLRKDFTVDDYQIYESKMLGASAVLLICALTSAEDLKRRISICDTLGISAVTEVHSDEEILIALECGARIIGVNNRNLHTFEVDFENSLRLRKLVPSSVLFVAESGIKTPNDIGRLNEAKVDAVLIGEALMRSIDKKAALNRLRNGCRYHDAGK